MHELFRGHEGAHGTHGVPEQEPGSLKWGIKRTARTVREPVTDELWEKHLKGETPLGIISIREDSKCLWGSIDVDDYSVNLVDLVDRIERVKFPLVLCRSKSGGAHLFLFLKEPIAAEDVQAALVKMAAALGLAGSEIFPKQTRVLAERGDLGNWMVMPYYGSSYGGKLKDQVGLKKTGAELTIEEFIERASDARLTPNKFEALRFEKVAAKKTAATAKTPSAPFGDGPRCLQYMATEKILTDGRKRALFMMALYFKRRDEATWETEIERANQEYMQPPLSSDEVVGVVRSLKKKDYEYTCKAEPMVSHCDARTCRSRKFGVGRGSSIPTISGLSKLDADPPMWFADVGEHRVQLTTTELQRYDLFHHKMLSVGVCYGAMKQSEWLETIREPVANHTIVDAPPDIGVGGRFQELLEEFCTNRRRGIQREDLLTGRPWHDEEGGRYWFRMVNFEAFWERQKVRDLSRAKVGEYVKALGGGHKQLRVKMKCIQTWWVPSSALELTPDVDPPPDKGQLI
jgi:hypothetical protein